MALENEEDYLESLLKSITEEKDSSSTEDLFEIESEIPMPETTEISVESEGENGSVNEELESLESIIANLESDVLELDESENMLSNQQDEDISVDESEDALVDEYIQNLLNDEDNKVNNNVSELNMLEDISEENVSELDILKELAEDDMSELSILEDISEENVSELDILKELAEDDMSELSILEDIPEENVPELSMLEEMPEDDMSKLGMLEDISEEDISESGISEELSEENVPELSMLEEMPEDDMSELGMLEDISESGISEELSEENVPELSMLEEMPEDDMSELGMLEDISESGISEELSEENVPELSMLEEMPENDMSDENDLISQLSGIIDNIENELIVDESEENMELIENETEEIGIYENVEENPVDLSAITMDEELKGLFGIENPEELVNLESTQEQLSADEVARINEIEAENNQFVQGEETVDLVELEDADMDLGFAGLMDLVAEAGIDVNSDESEEAATSESSLVDITESELSATKVQDKVNSKDSKEGFIAKLLAPFKKKNDKEVVVNQENENQQVLETLFDENGELVEEKKKVKKKSLFSWGKGSGDDNVTKESVIDELEDIEELDEPLFKKKEPDPEKEKKKQEKKEEKERKKKEKQEKAKKKAQERKKAKESKVKEPVDPSELIKIKPGVVITMLLVTAGLTVGVLFFINSFTYNNDLDAALVYLNEGKYTFAYEAIVGVEPKSEEDAALIEQITTIMYVQKVYNSYERYIKMGMNFEALDTLIKGFYVYDENYLKAEEIGVGEEVTEIKDLIAKTLMENYGITEEMARVYAAIEDYRQYEYIIQSYGGIAE